MSCLESFKKWWNLLCQQYERVREAPSPDRVAVALKSLAAELGVEVETRRYFVGLKVPYGSATLVLMHQETVGRNGRARQEADLKGVLRCAAADRPDFRFQIGRNHPNCMAMERVKVKTGYPEIDETFLVTTNDVDVLAAIMDDRQLRDLLCGFATLYSYCIPDGKERSLMVYCEAKECLDRDKVREMYLVMRHLGDRLFKLALIR